MTDSSQYPFKNSKSTVFRWGVLGTARTAEKRILPAILRANQKIAGIAGRTEKQLAIFKSKFDIDATFPWNQASMIIENPTVDAIYIPLPNALHAEWVIRALERKKNVFCEKPIALNLLEITKIVDTAVQQRLVVEENFSYHLTPGYRFLERQYATGETGPLDSIEIHHHFCANREHSTRYERMLGGGSLLDLGCYGIDFVHRFLKEKISVIEVKATPVTGEQRLWSSHPDYPVDSKASLIAQTPSGVKVLITTSFLDEARQSIIITAKNGIKYELPQAFRVGATASRILIHYPDGLISSHEFSTCDSDLEIIRTFAENVFKGESLGQEQTRRLRFTAEVLEKAQKFIYNNELFR